MAINKEEYLGDTMTIASETLQEVFPEKEDDTSQPKPDSYNTGTTELVL